MSSSTRSKVIVTVIALGGLVAVAGYLSERGFRITMSRGAIQSTQSTDGSRPQGRRSGKAKERTGQNRKPPAGRAPIALVVDGKATASLTGDALQGAVAEVTIASKHDPRTGWAIIDILQARGVTKARQVIFIDENGKRLETDWARVSDPRNRLILAYSAHSNIPIIFSGPEITEATVSPAQARELAGATPELIAFPHLVTIEVRG